MFGATGDQKSDVEKNPKKNCHKLRITNDNQFLTVLKTVHGARRTSWTNSIGNRGSAVFGATGDQKSDVEKNPKKIWQKLRITNDIQFLTALKTVYGARRTSWTNINVFACRYLWADGSSRNLTWILTRKKNEIRSSFFRKEKINRNEIERWEVWE